MANVSTNSTNTVVGYFSSHAKAQAAVDALKDAGFKSREIGMAARGGAFESGRSANDTNNTTSSAYQTGKNAGEHVESAWEKVKHFFEGDEHNSNTERDRETSPSQTSYGQDSYGQFGPEDMCESLTGLSVPEQHSRYFGHRFQNDDEGSVVTVSTSDRQEEAAAILREYDGDLGENAEGYDYASSSRDNVSGQTGSALNEPIRDTQNIRLYGEVLRVHKDRINRGEVRIRKEVITDTQTVEVPVTREEMVIERSPVSGNQAATDASFQDQEIRIPLTEERASVDKQAVVREEVRVGKREVTNVQSVDEQVRHEELRVDDTTKTA